MNFETQIALQRILLPAVCSLIGCYMLSRTELDEDDYVDEPVPGISALSIFGAAFCAVGMMASELWQRDLILKPYEWITWKASYRWEWIAWMIPGSMIALGLLRGIVTTPIHFSAMVGLWIGLMAIGVLYVCLNEGAAWADQTAKLLPWMAVSSAAALSNTAALNSIARSEGSRWVSCTILGQLGCVAAITLQSYASLGLCAVAGMGVALAASIIGAFFGSSSKLHYGWPLSTVVIPLAILAVACLVVSRFSFEAKTLPTWLIGSVFFLPSVIWGFDIVVGRVMANWFRVLLAAIICILAIGAILNITQPWNSEW